MNNIANTIAQVLFNTETELVDDVKKSGERERILNSYQSLFYSGKDYFTRNRPLYKTSLLLAIICQIATAFSSYSYYESSDKLDYYFSSYKPIIIVFILIIIEAFKWILSHFSLLSWFKSLRNINPSSPNYFLIGSATILVLFTVYTSVIGGGEIGTDKIKPIKVSDSFDSNKEKTLNDYNNEIKTIKAEYDFSINDLRLSINSTNHKHTNLKTGATWIDPKSKERTIINEKETQISNLVKQREKALKDLRLKRDSEVSLIEQNKSNEISIIESENKTSSTKYTIVFAIFDLLFVFCSYFNYSYRDNSVLERDVINENNKLTKPQTIVPTIIEPLKENIIVDNEINYPKEETINVRNFSNHEIVSNKIGFIQSFTNKTPIESKKVEVKPIEVEVKKEVDVQPKKEKEMDKIVYVEVTVPANSRECDHCKKKFAPIVPKNRFCAGHTCKNAWNHSFRKLKLFLETNKVESLVGENKYFFEKIKSQREVKLVNEFFEGLNL